KLVPEDQFGISGSSRPLDPGIDIKGVRVGVMGWLHDDVGFQLDTTLLAFLHDSAYAQPNTPYGALVHGLVEGGFAPTISYAGRIAGDSAKGFYVGGAVHYYLGVGYFRTDGDASFITGNPIFAGANPVTPDGRTVTQHSRPGNTLGHGVARDIGAAWGAGPPCTSAGSNGSACGRCAAASRAISASGSSSAGAAGCGWEGSAWTWDSGRTPTRSRTSVPSRWRPRSRSIREAG